ncbi:hypothetical protein BOTBODRAFT_47529 [Botryobasidium botryosum FD-172 SS1]|uniref:Uncharacterized protein n=1 Tax=Botryobasidium botryosum (strain FD-172 SS1) TaxID=930990 RepID=A0A067MD48_BOTB1|nr:hypothetical protein BOTBODRAFT_47529 [Botryobasidium botryosum FD-172 SS1]
MTSTFDMPFAPLAVDFDNVETYLNMDAFAPSEPFVQDSMLDYSFEQVLHPSAVDNADEFAGEFHHQGCALEPELTVAPACVFLSKAKDTPCMSFAELMAAETESFSDIFSEASFDSSSSVYDAPYLSDTPSLTSDSDESDESDSVLKLEPVSPTSVASPTTYSNAYYERLLESYHNFVPLPSAPSPSQKRSTGGKTLPGARGFAAEVATNAEWVSSRVSSWLESTHAPVEDKKRKRDVDEEEDADPKAGPYPTARVPTSTPAATVERPDSSLRRTSQSRCFTLPPASAFAARPTKRVRSWTPQQVAVV